MKEDKINLWTYNLSNHAPTPRAKKIINDVRILQIDTVEFFVNKLPDCRETDIAIQKIEEATFYAVAAMVRNENNEKNN